MKNLPLNPELFSKNRERFLAMMKKNSIAIIVSNDECPSNGDALYRFRQNSDLYWLTGITQEDSMVIFFPDNPDPKYREVLVLLRPNELKEKWDGKRLRANEAREMSGIQRSYGWIRWMACYNRGYIWQMQFISIATKMTVKEVYYRQGITGLYRK